MRAKSTTVVMRDIVKCFPGVRANSKVCFDVSPGEVHALLGENGAGKSTLMRHLTACTSPTRARSSSTAALRTSAPGRRIRAGIGMIHQHFMLVPTLTVAENVALGRALQPLAAGGHRARRRARARAGRGVRPQGGSRGHVWQLSVGEQQRVEILKALYQGRHLIILDEPTAVLTPQEVDDLFATLRRMVAEGHTLIFISHKLGEVMAISDRVTVLRDGKAYRLGQDLRSEPRRARPHDGRPRGQGAESRKARGRRSTRRRR